MYRVTTDRAGKVCILNHIFQDVESLLLKTHNEINKLRTEGDLQYWIYEMFTSEFEEEFGQYPNETLEKLALCILNAKHYLISDKQAFCEQFNSESEGLEIGFDNTFYPYEIGHWYSTTEFMIVLN